MKKRTLWKKSSAFILALSLISGLSPAITGFSTKAAESDTDISEDITNDEDTEDVYEGEDIDENTEEEPSPEEQAALHEAILNYTKNSFFILAKKDYFSKNGTPPTDCTFVLNEETKEAALTLLDENGNTLDVYSFNTQTGVGTNQKGEAFDLSSYVIPAEEYFVPFDYLSDIARLYFMDKDERNISGAFTRSDNEKDAFIITLSGDEDVTLAEYTVDIRTGIGTDEKGNAVDLSVYKDYKPIAEDDYFIAVNIIDDAALGYYAEKTGTPCNGTYNYFDNGIFTAQIGICDDEFNIIETYIIDLRTGIGKDSSGNPVDLAEYAKTHEVIDKDSIPQIDDSEFFAPITEIYDMAVNDYKRKTGIETQCSGYGYDEENSKLDLFLTDENYEEVVTYTIDPRTGKGKTSSEVAVDLPQTGINSLRNLLTIIGSFMMIVLGAVTVKLSSNRRYCKSN